MSGAKLPPRTRDHRKGEAVDVKTAAEMIGVSRVAVYTYLDKGLLGYYTERRGLRIWYLVYVIDIEKFLEYAS